MKRNQVVSYFITGILSLFAMGLGVLALFLFFGLRIVG